MANTIFALSSGTAPAAIGIVRLSGPDALVAAARMMKRAMPHPRTAVVRGLYDPTDGTLLDRCLMLFFPGPTSATGEDLIELHLHGGRAVIAAVERVLGAMPQLRRADPGEFTRRALASGRIDLTQVEGLGDLLMAETEGQRRAALLAAEGGVRHRIKGWTERAVAIAASVEAVLDFSDEDDVGEMAAEPIQRDLSVLVSEIERMLSEPAVERLRDGIRVAIAGPPNSGKSTLLNALAKRDAAIVASIAGTTRDVIEVAVSRDGVAYVLFDMAGIREQPGDDIERVGIDRAHRAIAAADIVLWLGDDAPPRQNMLWLHSRADERGRTDLPPGKLFAFSAIGPEGDVKVVWKTIADVAQGLLPKADQLALNARQRNLLAESANSFRLAGQCDDLLLMAEDVRLGLRWLHAISGRSDTEAVLDSIFARFCIGK